MEAETAANNQPDYDIFEVFSRKNARSAFTHQFSLLAPNSEMALALARDNFLRREDCVHIWVVRRSDICALSPEERIALARMENKTYRETAGYGDVQGRWRKFAEQAAVAEHDLKPS